MSKIRIIKNAFTLAEIMVVLSVIGILSAILLPVAFNAAPDENVMKFKKANLTLASAVRELVNSDKYYLDGDLGVRANGITIDGNHDGDATYFCRTLADVLSTKSVNCSEINKGGNLSHVHLGATFNGGVQDETEISYEINHTQKESFDEFCKVCFDVGAEIITADGITYYQANPGWTFGALYDGSYRLFGLTIWDSSGFDNIYKPFCIDIDGIADNATTDDCVNECPFGYGIRADGKIMTGTRADEWLEKSIQRGED